MKVEVELDPDTILMEFNKRQLADFIKNTIGLEEFLHSYFGKKLWLDKQQLLKLVGDNLNG